MALTSLERLFHPEERVVLFIDGANLYSAARALGVEIDFRKLREEFDRATRLIRAFYYTAVLEDQDFSPIKPLVDWLDYNGYAVITKPAREYTDANGRRRVKGDMDVAIAVDMMEAAAYVDHLVLFSGDGDFLPAVQAVQRRGPRVSVVSTARSAPPMAADELRRQADLFIDLTDLAALISRPARGGGEPSHEG